jgi:hypothetical protein
VTSLFRRAVGVVTGLGAALLIALALPRLLASLTVLPSAPTLSRLQSLEPVDTTDLQRLVRNQRRALVWQASGRTWTDLGLAQLLLAERLGDEDPRSQPRFSAARQALIEGLSVAPANPFAWSRLAYAEAVLSSWSERAASALRMAFITGPYEPRLLWPRLRLALAAWPYIPPADQEMVLHQLRQAWTADPEALTALVSKQNQVDLARTALAGSPSDLRAFDTLVASRRP